MILRTTLTSKNAHKMKKTTPLKIFYDYVQTLEPKISRNKLRDKALEVTGNSAVKTVWTDLDKTKCRGFFLSASNMKARLVQQCGCNIIVLPRDKLNNCWERFIYVKELMHLFDNREEATDSGDSFEILLNELQAGATIQTKQFQSELKCFWLALSALCPEEIRKEFKNSKEKGLVDDYGIATTLKIPQQYIPHLLSNRYHNEITSIFSNP